VGHRDDGVERIVGAARAEESTPAGGPRMTGTRDKENVLREMLPSAGPLATNYLW
jgi:hypothetical protein